MNLIKKLSLLSLIVGLGIVFIPNNLQAAGVLKRFKQAEALFDKKDYQAAISAYLGIIKSYPSHEPSRIKVARSYFKLGKLDLSYEVFAAISLDRLDAEASYEAGQVFLRKEKYDQAERALRRVPQGHSLFDLASYYGGVAAAKKRNYRESLSLFEQAVVLPGKLVRSKRAYQKLAQEKLLQEQKKRDELAERQRRKEAERQSKAQLRNRSPRKPASVPVEGFFKGDKAIGVVSDFIAQTQDFSGDLTANTDRSEVGVEGRLGHSFYVGDRKKKHHIFANAVVRSSGLNLKGKVLPIVADPALTYRTELMNLTQASSLTSALVQVGPEWNIGQNAWIGLLAQYEAFSLGSDDGPTNASLPRFTLSLGQKALNYSIRLRLETYTQNFDEAKRLEQAFEHFEFSFHLNKRLTLGVGVELSQFKYTSGQDTDGPDWYTRATGRFVYAFTPALMIDIVGYYQQIEGDQFNFLTDPNGTPVDQINFSHIGAGSLAKLSLSLGEWLSASLQAATHSRDDQGLDGLTDTQKRALKAEYPTFLFDISGQINASFHF